MIDAVDGVGKTTVCNILSEKLNAPVIKMPNMHQYFKEGNAEVFSKLFNQTIVQFKQYSFIMDRGFLSSIVYSKIYNRDFDLSYLREIEEELACKIIVLTARPEVFLARKANDEIIKNEFRIKLNEEYVNLAKERGYIIIDTSDMTPEEVSDEVLKKIQ